MWPPQRCRSPTTSGTPSPYCEPVAGRSVRCLASHSTRPRRPHNVATHVSPRALTESAHTGHSALPAVLSATISADRHGLSTCGKRPHRAICVGEAVPPEPSCWGSVGCRPLRRRLQRRWRVAGDENDCARQTQQHREDCGRRQTHRSVSAPHCRRCHCYRTHRRRGPSTGRGRTWRRVCLQAHDCGGVGRTGPGRCHPVHPGTGTRNRTGALSRPRDAFWCRRRGMDVGL